MLTKDYLRARLFFSADKTPQGVPANMKQELAEANARIEQLTPQAEEAKNLRVENAALVQERDELKAKLDASESKVAQLEADLKASNLRADAAETEARVAKQEAAADKTKAEQAEANLKTADARAEQTLRETYAAAGVTLPAKKAGAGDHTVDKPVDASAHPAKRLASIFKVSAN